MDFALLGCDAEALALVQAALRRGHRLVWAHDLGTHAAEVRALSPGAVIAPHWEALLGGAIAQAVIVAAGEGADADRPQAADERAEQLRKLAAERVPLLVCHPAHDSTLLMLELDMIRRDAGGVLLPYIAARWHGAVAHVRELLSGGSLGPLEQIVCERTLPNRSREQVLRCFLADVPLLRQFVGELNKVGAMAAAAGDTGWANLGVQLSGPSAVLARWSVAPGETAGCRASFVGTRGKVTLHMPTGSLVWTVEGPGSGEPQAFDGASAAAAAIESLEQALATQPPPDDWADAVHAARLAEGVERSVRRGRVISLEYDEHTEEGTFKGVMATVGCGLLLLGPIVSLFAAAVIHRFPWILGFRRLRSFAAMSFGDLWLWTLGASLAVFLLLQFSLLLIPKKRDH